MEAVIVAAGRGSRCGCVGRKAPKSLFKVAGIPLLYHQLSALREAGIKKVTLVLGHLAEKFPIAFEGLEICQVINKVYLNTGGGYSFLLGSAGVDDDLIYLVSDILYDAKLIESLVGCTTAITLGLQMRPTKQDDMKVNLSHDYVTAISKDLDPGLTKGAFLGTAIIPRQELAQLRMGFQHVLDNSIVKTQHFGELLRELINEGMRIKWQDLSGFFWCEIDTIQDLIKARKKWQEAGYSFELTK